MVQFLPLPTGGLCLRSLQFGARLRCPLVWREWPDEDWGLMAEATPTCLGGRVWKGQGAVPEESPDALVGEAPATRNL